MNMKNDEKRGVSFKNPFKIKQSIVYQTYQDSDLSHLNEIRAYIYNYYINRLAGFV